LNRRHFIKLSAVCALGSLFSNRSAWATSNSSAWRLTASETEHRFESGQAVSARVMAFNNSTPGPVLRLPQGVESEILFVNDLDQLSSIHWHGLRIANAMDGVPGITQQPVLPGQQFVYRFTPPDAGTFWYHSHHRSWEQLALGLAGVLIVEEREALSFDQDLVFAVDDWRVNNALDIDRRDLGALHDWAHGGRLGNYATVNGRSVPQFPVVSGQRVRLRAVNIANSRIMTLRFPQAPAWVIALDGQPVKPLELDTGLVTLAPGQRADLAVDLTGSPGSESSIELLAQNQVLEVARFSYQPGHKRKLRTVPPEPLPATPTNEVVLPDTAGSKRVPLRLEGGAMGGLRSAVYKGRELGFRELARINQVWAINGIAGLDNAPLFRVPRGTAINLEVDNNNAWPHGMHVHGHHFVDSREPWYWRDTALFARGERANLRFIADNPGKWLIHCHMIEHQAGGMLTWFEVS
jgi:FtsP/CotA-like multicopper oxidase with cupredoxin domain